jgi:hypothetical protein
MNQDQFWTIIERACRSDLHKTDEWAERLEAELMCLAPDEIVEWNHIFDRLVFRARTVDLWGAAYTINGGASDDGFYYFRCWLVGMGKDVYEAALANPDNLATVVEPRVDAEAEIYAAAHQAWMAVTGRPDTDPYPARNEYSDQAVTGEDWNFDDVEEVRRRLPRIAAIYRK